MFDMRVGTQSVVNCIAQCSTVPSAVRLAEHGDYRWPCVVVGPTIVRREGKVAHIREIEIEEYRGIGGRKLTGFGDINLVVGDNGTGKSSLLEVIWLFSGRGNVSLLWQHQVQRTDVQETNPMANLEVNRVSVKGAEVLENGQSKRTSYEIDFVPASPDWADKPQLKEIVTALASVPPMPGVPPGPKQLAGEVRCTIDRQLVKFGPHGINLQLVGNDCVIAPNVHRGFPEGSVLTGMLDLARTNALQGDWYRAIATRGREEKRKFIETLQVVRPEVSELEMIPRTAAGASAPYFQVVTTEGKALRAESLGNGFKKLLDVALSITAARNGILLLDEMENGISQHRTDKYCEAVLSFAARYNTQVIATTHSDYLTTRLVEQLEGDDAGGEALKEDRRTLRIFDLDDDSVGELRGISGKDFQRRKGV